MIYPVILCGGSGTRLWPLSRKDYPKQFSRIFGEDSLFQKTLERVGDPARFAPPIVVCNEAQRFLAAEQLRAAGCAPAALILEPAGRNTAPAIATAALAAGEGPAELLLVLPSDHLIAETERFLEDPGSPNTFRFTQGPELFEAASIAGLLRWTEKWEFEGRQTVSLASNSRLDTRLILRRFGHDVIFETELSVREGEGTSLGFTVRPFFGFSPSRLGYLNL